MKKDKVIALKDGKRFGFISENELNEIQTLRKLKQTIEFEGKKYNLFDAIESEDRIKITDLLKDKETFKVTHYMLINYF